MNRHSNGIILLVSAALVTGCGSDRALGPDAGRETRFSIRVTPDKPVLFVAGPVTSRRLGIMVLDEKRQIIHGPFSIAYSSSAPAIAPVSSDGVVTGVAVGTATITTTVSYGGATQSVAIPVSVGLDPLDYWHIAGTYDLSASVAPTTDPLGWISGAPPYEYTGVLTFLAGTTVGSFEDVPLFDEGGETVLTASAGPITLDVPASGALFGLRLGPTWRAFVDSVEEAGDGQAPTVIKGRLTGTFVEEWWTTTLSGPFVARLRQ